MVMFLVLSVSDSKLGPCRTLIFNMHVISAVVAEDPECRIDADCPSMHACIADRCQNPCLLRNPCKVGQECVVEDTLPLRTMACICPDGFYIGNNGECVQVTGVSQCEVHFDCRNTEQCHSGSCIDACRVEQCGTNAICTSRDHTISCECPPGYNGDPRVACYPSEYFHAHGFRFCIA